MSTSPSKGSPDSRPQKRRQRESLHDVVMSKSSQFWLDSLHTLEVLRFQIVSKSAKHWINTADHLEPLTIIKLPSTQHCWSHPYTHYNELKNYDVEQFENPALQAHFRMIESLALFKTDEEEICDTTMPGIYESSCAEYATSRVRTGP